MAEATDDVSEPIVAEELHDFLAEMERQTHGLLDGFPHARYAITTARQLSVKRQHRDRGSLQDAAGLGSKRDHLDARPGESPR
jgi:hypothetical protein